MGLLYGCSLCCMLLSIWGVVQLVLMGIFYHLESVVLIEDAQATVYSGYEDFIDKTRHNYRQIAVNCWIAAAIYAVITVLTIGCFYKAKRDILIKQANLEDDDVSCRVQEKMLSEKEKKHIK